MTKWCIKHRSIMTVLAIFIFVAGGYLYTIMERQENPNVVSPGAIVKVIYPGATPEDVEKFIVKPLEKKIAELNHIKRIESHSLNSVGVVVVRLKDINDNKIKETWNKLKDKVDNAKADLPEQAWEPEIDTELVETYGVLFTVSGDKFQYDELKSIADEIKGDIERISGVAEVKLDGYEDKEIHVNMDILKMRQYNISLDQIAKMLMATNINIPGGNMELGNTKLSVSTTGEYESIEEIKNTIVSISEEGNLVYLKDIANVVEAEKKRDVYVHSNGEKALLIAVKFSEGQNVVKVGEQVNDYLQRYRKNMPEGMSISIITDQAAYVNDAIKLFERNLISAIILVLVVVLMTMGWRSALVVASSIPISVMVTFLFMKMTGIILHQVSISSLIVCLGLMVANAIVANDNMYLYLERGELDREMSIVEGIREVRIPILTSTLTTVASFLPLLMMKGVAGKFVKTLPILVTVALMSSYICSLTVVPVMGYSFLKVKSTKTKTKFNKLSEFFMIKYKRALDIVLSKPRLTLLGATILLGLTALLIPRLGLQLFPFVERDQYVIDVTTMEGSTVEKTRDVVRQIEDILDKNDKVDTYLAKVGDGIPKFYPSFFPNQISSNKAQFIVNGSKYEINNIQKEIDKTIPGSRIEVKQLENAIPVGIPVQIRVSGEDIETLRQISKNIKEKLYEIEEGQNVQDDFGFETPKLKVNVNKDKANMVGLTNYDISKTIRMVVNGIEVTKIKPIYSDDDIGVILKVPEEDKNNKELLEQIYITSSITGENIPLEQVADIETEFAINKILRRDRVRTITTGLYPKKGYNASDLLKIVKEKVKDIELPMGYNLEFGGENEDRTEAFKSLIGPFFLSAALIYLILMFQFFDLRQPFIIMGTIPLSFIGVILGLKITGFPIGFMALMGAVSLMGIVVNNGIVLLDYINILTKSGKDFLESIKVASTTRLRPIMIGMVTTTIGLLPMGLAGGSLWAPLAYSLIFGLFVSSILTMLVIPASFLVFKRAKEQRAILFKKIIAKNG